MKPVRRLSSTTAALCAAGLLPFISAIAFDAHAATAGMVVGPTGVYQGAVVCLDANLNGRCDAGEVSTVSDASGAFAFTADGAVVAEIGTTASLVDATTHVATPVTRALRFRAPASSSSVLSGTSTELQALIEAYAGDTATAIGSLAQRLGVTPAQVVENPLTETNATVRATLLRENDATLTRIADAVTEAAKAGDAVKTLRNRLALDAITNVVVIYAENRSFDGLYGLYPGVNGLKLAASKIKQVDRDGKTVLPMLPPAWSGMTASGQTPVVTQAQTTNVWPNASFQIDSPVPQFGYSALPNTVITRDLYHRFFENAMQINGGRNDQYVAWADSGGLVMGYYDGSSNKMWQLAKQYTLADNFFQAAYGGSFLNHQYLACACAPTVPASVVTANGMSLNVLTTPINGVPQLAATASQKASALDGAASLQTGNIAPRDYFGAGDGYRAVNTMQPAYQPSGNKPVDNVGNHGQYAATTASTTLPPQTQTHIGDLLNTKSLGWTWYAGGWNAAVAQPYPYDSTTGQFGASTTIYYGNSFGTGDAAHADFQTHHQPFNYFADMDPATHAADRAAHMKDRSDLLQQAAAGTLPAVTFYKPVGWQNQHPGYANATDGDDEIAEVVAKLQAGPQWGHMLILVTYDEFGGQFDHVAPPKGDLVGPGTRIPALLISPFARKGYVDHTQYDTGSFLRFVTHRWSLPVLDGLQMRDKGLIANGNKPMGDLTNALSF